MATKRRTLNVQSEFDDAMRAYAETRGMTITETYLRAAANFLEAETGQIIDPFPGAHGGWRGAETSELALKEYAGLRKMAQRMTDDPRYCAALVLKAAQQLGASDFRDAHLYLGDGILSHRQVLALALCRMPSEEAHYAQLAIAVAETKPSHGATGEAIEALIRGIIPI